MNGRQSMCMSLWIAVAALACCMLLTGGCALQKQSNGEWQKLAVPPDVKTGTLALSDVAVAHGHLVLLFWGGQKLAVLALSSEGSRAKTEYRYVNLASPVQARRIPFGEAIAATNGDNLYVSHSEAVYRVSLENLSVEKVTNLAVPCGLARLTCSPSGTLYGLWLPAVVDKLSIWEIDQDGYATRQELDMPAEFASSTWVASILADEQGLYILLLNNYGL